MRIIHFLIALTTLSQINIAQANIHAALSQQAEAYVASLLPEPDIGIYEISASKLDNRVIIPSCDGPFQTIVNDFDRDTILTNVVVRCPNVANWSVYIPVRIYQLVPTVVAAYNIGKGDVIGPDSLRIKFVDIKTARGGANDDISEFVGAKSKRRISAGQTINESKICLVCKGESVTMVISASGLNIKTVGSALTDGVKGESISVKNQASGRIVDGVIENAGEVKIIL